MHESAHIGIYRGRKENPSPLVGGGCLRLYYALTALQFPTYSKMEAQGGTGAGITPPLWRLRRQAWAEKDWKMEMGKEQPRL